MSYLIMANVSFTVLVVLYLAVFNRLTFFHWNRFYLLFALIFSAFVPLLKLSFFTTSFSGIAIVELPTVIIEATSEPALAPLFSIGMWIYWLGVLIGLSILIKGGYDIFKLRASAKRETTFCGDYLISEGKHAFSFFRSIQIGNDIEPEVRDMILTHEKVHVGQWHSVDIVLYSMARVLAWFNPLVHIATREVTLNHEYLADGATNKAYGSDYQYSLLNQVLDTNVFQLTNSFYSKSIIKNRILMMNSSKSKGWSLAAYALTIPVIVGSIWLSSCSQQPGLPDSHQKEVAAETMMKPIHQEFFTSKDVDQLPSFPGGQDEMLNYFRENFQYPQELKEANVEGKVAISFIVNEDGSLSDFASEKADDDRLFKPAVEFVKAMPAWTPGMINGENVKVKMILPVQYTMN